MSMVEVFSHTKPCLFATACNMNVMLCPVRLPITTASLISHARDSRGTGRAFAAESFCDRAAASKGSATTTISRAGASGTLPACIRPSGHTIQRDESGSRQKYYLVVEGQRGSGFALLWPKL